jgi:radical SAM enzyme (TIGR01210 family)
VSEQWLASYPSSGAELDRWIIEQRPAREVLDPQRPYAFFVEDECSESGAVVPVATIFLTNRECPWRCVMCDLWRNALTNPVPAGAIAAQIDYALTKLPAARELKLYNSGSFFDSGAIPVEDHPAIATRANGYQRLIVESHPSLVGDRVLKFRDGLTCRLEVAMGLETAHPEILAKLNKRMTLEQFSTAAKFLRVNDIDLRVFILVQPPFMSDRDSLYWAERSLDFAFDCGAAAATLIPTRGGNGAMEALAEAGLFSPPNLQIMEAAASYGLSLKRGRVFADLWDIKKVKACSTCRTSRIARLREMNLVQKNIVMVSCDDCTENN